LKAAFHTCLLIDDNSLDNYINTFLIRHYNFANQVITLESSQDALKFIGNDTIQPDIIFLDIRMPLMDGFEFIKEYAKLENIKPSTKLFILSSTCDPSDIARAENNKYVTKFIEKTLTGEKLASIVNTHQIEPMYPTINGPNGSNQLSA
jgi:response regulator RpfG family c-di-GMP phosphodiesterase